MRNTFATDCQRRSGATIVEMAVVLPVFFVFIFGVIEVTWAFTVYSVVQSATNRAAREGAPASKSEDDVRAVAEQILASIVAPSDADIQIKDASELDDPDVDPNTIDIDSLPNADLDNAATRALFIVRVRLPYRYVSVSGLDWPDTMTVIARAVQRKE